MEVTDGHEIAHLLKTVDRQWIVSAGHRAARALQRIKVMSRLEINCTENSLINNADFISGQIPNC